MKELIAASERVRRVRLCNSPSVNLYEPQVTPPVPKIVDAIGIPNVTGASAR